jgi:hypothetical protein
MTENRHGWHHAVCCAHIVAGSPLYNKAALIEHRRNILRNARSFPPGPERNQHRQITLSLRTLFRDREWREAHVLKDPQ